MKRKDSAWDCEAFDAMLNETYRKCMAKLEHSSRLIEKMQRGEWEDDDEDNYQSSSNYSKGDYYENRW